jgi:hypothetical protein
MNPMFGFGGQFAFIRSTAALHAIALEFASAGCGCAE